MVQLDVIGAADGLRLDGTYAATSSHDFVKTGTATPGGLTQQHSIQFATDGRFGTGGSVTWGSPQAGRGGAYTRDGGVGTYRINGNTLELTLGGNRQALTFFVHPDHVKEQRPELIVLDGVVFQLEK